MENKKEPFIINFYSLDKDCGHETFRYDQGFKYKIEGSRIKIYKRTCVVTAWQANLKHDKYEDVKYCDLPYDRCTIIYDYY